MVKRAHEDSVLLFTRIFNKLARCYYKAKFVFSCFPYRVVLKRFSKLIISSDVKCGGRGIIYIGSNVTLSQINMRSCETYIEAREKLSEIIIGNGCSIMNGCELIARERIEIGDNTLIGPRVVIYDSDFHGIQADKRHEPGVSMPIKIGRNVWIGAEALILKGVSIGDHAIVAARAVVTKNVPSGKIAVGNPAKILNRNIADELISE